MRLHAIAAGVAGVTLLVAGVSGQSALDKVSKLRNPASLTETAPAIYRANFETSKGTFIIQVNREWAPIGADRFYNLVKNGFYDDVRFFRVISGFMAQFGMNGNPTVSSAWQNAAIKDDPVKQSNKPGYVTFAKRGAPNSRTTQIFINYADNSRLDADGFAPFGQVISGMDVVTKFEPGEADQGRITSEGNAYLIKEHKFDYVKAATISK